MNECINFTNTLRVGSCGDKIWLGTAITTETMQLLVTYYLNGDEVSDFFDPIIEGSNVFLDLTTPYTDYYNPFNTYYISLTDTSGYFSNGTQLANGGNSHDGFIVHFSSAKNADDRLITI